MSRLLTRLRRPSGVVLLALSATLVVVASGSRTWVTGTTADAVLGSASVSATGTEVVSGLVALALAATAAAIAAATAGRIGRWLAVGVLTLVSLGLAVQVGRFIAAPGDALGRVAAGHLGRTGALQTHPTLGGWSWIAVAAAVLLLAAALLALVGASSWGGLGRRYEAGNSDAAGPRGQRVRSDWDRLDAGEDPTEPT
ncbi:MAG: Trp biosynthesis-associated membrane protein [Nostocoides sp.]